MTDTPTPNSPPNKRKLFVYRGPQVECHNVIYELLESPVKEGDEWKSDEQKMVYLHSIDRNIQPDSVKSKFANYNLGSHNDLNFCEVDNNGVGGYLSMETENNFKKFYKQLGQT